MYSIWFYKQWNILGVGTFDELASKKNAKLQLKIRGKNIADKFGFVYEGNGIYSKPTSGDQEVNALIQSIMKDDGEIYEAMQQKWSLEQLYFKYIKGTSDGVSL